VPTNAEAYYSVKIMGFIGGNGEELVCLLIRWSGFWGSKTGIGVGGKSLGSKNPGLSNLDKGRY